MARSESMTTQSAAAPPRAPTVVGFALRALAWLPIAFVVWYFAAPVLLFPVVLLLRGIAWLGFADVVRGIEQTMAVVTFVTALRPGAIAPRGVLTVDVNLLLYAFGMPLFAALTFAAHEAKWKRHLALGYVVLLPCAAWGALADFLKNVAITAGSAVAAQTGFSGAQREVIAFAFQFGSLILPAVAPAVLWVAMHGSFITALRHRERTN
jgi:hypothetical protein